MSTLSPFEHTAIGALAGVLEVSVMQPTVTVKNALQEGRALPKTPLAFYRGYLVGAYWFELILASGHTPHHAHAQIKCHHRSTLAALHQSQLSNLVPIDFTR